MSSVCVKCHVFCDNFFDHFPSCLRVYVLLVMQLLSYSTLKWNSSLLQCMPEKKVRLHCWKYIGISPNMVGDTQYTPTISPDIPIYSNSYTT
jgi:hypothetical protein